MKWIFKENRIVIISVVAAITIILVAFVANGSEYEDTWLYISGLWIVAIPLFDLVFKKKKK